MIIRLIVPFAYSLILGIVWSACAKKKFYNSLAPAYMLHVLLVLISGLVFNRLSVGIYGGIILATMVGVIVIIKNRNNITLNSIYARGRELWNGGVFVFLAFYIFCFLINYSKAFMVLGRVFTLGYIFKGKPKVRWIILHVTTYICTQRLCPCNHVI